MSALEILRTNAIATIVFSRPERRNALSLGMMESFEDALAEIAADDAVRVLILTGAGDKAFGAGLDIKEAATLTPDQHARQHLLYESIQRRLAAFPKPLLAAIEGVAAGASLQMALHCDLVVVSETARIGMPELSAGRPCIMGSYLLASRLGPAFAARLVLGQDWIDADGALTAGLAASKAPAGGALAEASAYAQKLAATAPSALAATLAWLRELRNQGIGSLDSAFAKADEILPAAANSQEALDGSKNFATRHDA